MVTRFSQAQVLRLHPLSPWQVALSFSQCFSLSPFFFFFLKLQCAAHIQSCGRTEGRHCGNQTGGTPLHRFFLFSQHCQVLLKCGRRRTLTGSHLQTHTRPHAHVQRCIQTHRGYTISGQVKNNSGHHYVAALSVLFSCSCTLLGS